LPFQNSFPPLQHDPLTPRADFGRYGGSGVVQRLEHPQERLAQLPFVAVGVTAPAAIDQLHDPDRRHGTQSYVLILEPSVGSPVGIDVTRVVLRTLSTSLDQK